MNRMDAAPENPALDRIRSVIEHLRPYVRSHGGQIELVSFDAGVVRVRLRGACAHCPQSQMTLKHGLEQQLQILVPEVREVVAI